MTGGHGLSDKRGDSTPAVGRIVAFGGSLGATIGTILPDPGMK